ncbi:hypothetical protein [Selenomonas ruminantium]|uniref:hypothetical protein n=1 Tax=Selenomonas ruminantium TaxID=971 RepID=UPI0026E95DD1|nr:hypothetical protein [Selenomonas ruminantium]
MKNAFYYWIRKIREDFVEDMPDLPAVASAETQFAVLSAASVTASLSLSGSHSALKHFIGPVVLEITESTSREWLLRTLGCVKDVFPNANP